MSYDIICYRSNLGKPDLEEALEIIEADEEGSLATAPETKLSIAKALMEHNPRLERFEFNYEDIARVSGISVEDAKRKYTQIELNVPEGDQAIQITIFDNTASITVPYWYTDEEAIAVFNSIGQYATIIRQEAGYFVYDPQREMVFDPLTESIL